MPTIAPEILEKHENRRIPRYTSYPTAPHFAADVDAARYRSWLGRLAPDASLSVYLHIPYCRQMCWYCGCHTKITRRYDPIERYVRSLETEMATVAGAMPDGHAETRRTRHVHWGGGSPNMVSAADFERLMAVIDARFG
ncbi:MAG: coproporphyrinogen III oxidase, partial [Alphaproteobacteria bacterium]|nr:coproporphyrinogen III oxidase [Alphaproteobacteria bacterium]